MRHRKYFVIKLTKPQKASLTESDHNSYMFSVPETWFQDLISIKKNILYLNNYRVELIWSIRIGVVKRFRHKSMYCVHIYMYRGPFIEKIICLRQPWELVHHALFHIIFFHPKVGFRILINIYSFHNVFVSYVLGSLCAIFYVFVKQK